MFDSHYLPLINGEFTAFTEETFPATDATTGERLAVITRSGAAEVDAAVAAAKAAFPAWSATPAAERAKLLLKVADWLEENTERLVRIDAHDIGRTVFELPQDYRQAIGQYRFFASAISTHDGWNNVTPGGWAIAKREPLGVVGAIIPWNVPAIMVSFKLAPALAAGNTVVLKPDENASLSTLELAKYLAEIFPAGVVNVVPGFGEEAGAALTGNPDVAKLAFTGSTEVGRIIAHAGASRLVPVTLELGGKSPNIVFPDIDDIDAVVDNVTFAATFCNGQSCLAGTRLFLHDDIYDTFMEKLVTAFRSIRVGSPLDPETRLGSVVSPKQGERVLKYIETGKAEAKLITGGERVEVPGHEAGWFIAPTIFETTNDSTIAQEEIFGPVLSVIRWNDFDTMIEQANDIRYGLASGVYTSNLRNAMRTADRLQAGQVWVNQYVNLVDGSPFGGYKESGLGREVAKETLDAYTQLKSVMLAEQVPPPFYV
ncbi:aldehyde dehydrogenase family protein [Streptomyces sp. J2-1]|uniref:aldehyde dehydrogenase family protein n=1 Tax=Streptomyces corallincola TaxID=2851888 RepID=UPI001C38E766|nr:aldehyde dehydrogenase family protein [Streptomyces corallincola]MBV2355432.1 aldehyde dehydrogenase family protein [Streptomyces corallincola]